MKTSWRYLCKTSWRCLEDILKTSSKRLEDVLKMPWRGLEDVFKRPWRRLENVLKTYGQDEYIGLDQEVLKTSSSRRIFAGSDSEIMRKHYPKLWTNTLSEERKSPWRFIKNKFRHWEKNSSHFTDEFFCLAIWKHWVNKKNINHSPWSLIILVRF